MRSWMLNNHSFSSVYTISLKRVYSCCCFTTWTSNWLAAPLIQAKTLYEVTNPSSHLPTRLCLLQELSLDTCTCDHLSILLWSFGVFLVVCFGWIWEMISHFGKDFIYIQDCLASGIHFATDGKAPEGGGTKSREAEASDLKSSSDHWEQWVAFSYACF